MYTEKVKNFFGATWKFMAELSGVIATLVILLSVSKYIILFIKDSFSRNVYILGLVLSALVISLIFLLKSFSKNLFAIKNLWEKEKINEALTEKKVIGSVLNLDKFLPEEKFFENIYKIASQEFRSWAHDAEIMSFNCYIERDGQNVKTRVQVYAVSMWKKEKMAMYLPSLSKNFEAIKSSDYINETLFFNVTGWKNAVKLAYERESTKISNNFKIQICANSEHVLLGEVIIPSTISINIYYMNGHRNEIARYQLVDGNLTAGDGTSLGV